MSVKIVHEISEITDRVNSQSVYVSDPVGDKNSNSAMRIADVIPVTNSETDIVTQFLYQAGVNILEEIGAYTKDIDYPYTITDSTDPEFPNSIIFEVELNKNSKEGVALPMLQQAIADTLIYYILTEWVKVKNYNAAYLVFQTKYDQALKQVKSSLMYGNKAKKPYKIM